MWFKNKKQDGEVCGYLDLNRNFHESKEERDRADNNIKLHREIQNLCDRFDNIMSKFRPYELDSLSAFSRFSNYDKIQILKLAAEYLKIEEKYDRN